MENCIYQGKLLCTLELKDDTGYYYEDKVLEWKEAAAGQGLTCVECGAPVYLAAGPIKEPYFAHYDIEACDYGSGKESEELKKGKRLLYHMLKRSFPEWDIQVRYRLENGMYSTLFCANGEQKVAIDYRLENTSLEKYRERDNYYRSKDITIVYILGKRRDKKTEQPDWYQSLILKSMGYLAFLDTDQETLILKKDYSYRLGKERRFQSCRKAYPIGEIRIDWDGMPICDFTKECDKLEQVLETEKKSYQRMQDQLKALREEKQRLDELEAERMEAYRRYREQEKLAYDTMLQSDSLTDDQLTALGLNPGIYNKCLVMVQEGNSHLVSAKYLEVIKKQLSNRQMF